jgi:hypothetical protein
VFTLFNVIPTEYPGLYTKLILRENISIDRMVVFNILVWWMISISIKFIIPNDFIIWQELINELVPHIDDLVLW